MGGTSYLTVNIQLVVTAPEREIKNILKKSHESKLLLLHAYSYKAKLENKSWTYHFYPLITTNINIVINIQNKSNLFYEIYLVFMYNENIQVPLEVENLGTKSMLWLLNY